jgi:methionyl-tRNA formyltransferase
MRETRIGEEESAEELGARLALMGADALVETLNFLEGEWGPVPQDESRATTCPKITREDARVDWTRPAVELARRSRAFTPWPGLFTIRKNTRVKLSRLSPVASAPWLRDGAEGSSPGTILEAGTRLVVACGEGAVSIGTLQAEGRRALPVAEFIRGERVLPGERWG